MSGITFAIVDSNQPLETSGNALQTRDGHAVEVDTIMTNVPFGALHHLQPQDLQLITEVTYTPVGTNDTFMHAVSNVKKTSMELLIECNDGTTLSVRGMSPGCPNLQYA